MRRNVTARFVRRGSADEREFNRDFWQNVSAEKKFAAAFEMLDDYDLIRGSEHAGQSRLQRSVQHIQRRKR